MKSVKVGVNTTRVHWVVEKLQALGIQDITVIEHFKPLSQISEMTFVCEDYIVSHIKKVIHKYGTCGNAVDHYVFVEDFENHSNFQAIRQDDKNLFYPNS
jgi:nitrogen regulatory protein PII